MTEKKIIDLRDRIEEIKKIRGEKMICPDTKIVHTRADHDCDGCGKVIPKGSYVPCYYIGSPWAGHWCWCCSVECYQFSLDHPSY